MRVLDLIRSGEIEDALVIAPKSTLGAWERDIELFTPMEQEMLRAGVTLINYDKVWRTSKTKPNVYDKHWGCIILDEAHFIKNRTSQRSKFILKLATKSDYRYILTGTPIGNGQLENIWSQYCFLDPYLERGKVYSKIFKGSYYNWQDRYCILNQYWSPSTYINVKELQDTIAAYSYRVKKEDCLDLPDKLPDEIIEIELKEKATYKKLHDDSALLEYEILAENPLSRMIKLRQLCSGFIKLETDILDVGCEKLSALDEFLEGYDKKLVIFAEFKHSIASISKLLKKKKIKFVTLDGDQKDKQIWRKFQADEKIRVIVCQYQSASAGIDLFSADTIIYYEPTLRSNVLEQSRDRIHRTGQTSKCSYLHFLTKGTIEMNIYKALSGFGDFSEKLFTEYMNKYQKSYSGRK